VGAADPEYKALGFNSCVRALKAVAPPERLPPVWAALPPDTRALVETPPLPIEWLSYRHSFALFRTAHDVAFDRDVRRTAEIARRAVRDDMNVVHKLLVRLASPEQVITRAARLWGNYWRNNGEVRIERREPKHIWVHYSGQQHATPLFWAMQCACVKALADATGVAGVRAAVDDGRACETSCVIAVSWT
jgi:hypothetical protein